MLNEVEIKAGIDLLEVSVVTAIIGQSLAMPPERVTKGWSHDDKFKITTCDGQSYMMRLLPPETLVDKQKEMKYLKGLDGAFNVSVPLKVGLMKTSAGEKAYTLSRWVEGRDAEVVLPTLSIEKQRALGRQAGQLIFAIHQIPVSEALESWGVRYQRKIDKKLAIYDACGETFDEASFFMKIIGRYRHMVDSRPTVFMHGDFHVGNMVISDDGEIGIIDFNRFDFGDPYDEFNRMMFSVSVSKPFSIGMIEGYFADHVPDDFFPLMMLYHAVNQVGAIPWAMPYGAEEVACMKQFAKVVAGYYPSVDEPVPLWFRKE